MNLQLITILAWLLRPVAPLIERAADLAERRFVTPVHHDDPGPIDRSAS